MPETPADIWGHCEFCSRWFACPGWFDKQAVQPTCPVCLSEPTAIEDRAHAGHPRAQIALLLPCSQTPITNVM